MGELDILQAAMATAFMVAGVYMTLSGFRQLISNLVARGYLR